jgi:hypothetical protein
VPVFAGLAFAWLAEAETAAADPLLAGLAAGSVVLGWLTPFGAEADSSADAFFSSAAGVVSSLGATPLIVSSAMLLPPRHAAMVTSAEPGAPYYGTWRAPSTEEPLLSWFVL